MQKEDKLTIKESKKNNNKIEDKEILCVENLNIKQSSEVFYNPAQQFNREISTLVISEYTKNKKSSYLFEAMSATGIRSIKYLKEISNINVHINDISKASINLIKENLSLNNIPTHNYKITNDNCNTIMNTHPNHFDIIDIDPYGSSVPFIASALNSIKHRGLLCLTFTDLAVLCSKKERCFSKYNSLTVKDPNHNEIAIRIALQAIEKEALKLDYHIEPILSVAIDFYLRTFVIVHKRKKIRNNLNMFFKCSCGYKKIRMTKNKEKNKINEDDKTEIENSNLLSLFHPSNISDNNINNNKNTILPSVQCFTCRNTPLLCGPFWSTEYKNQGFISNILKKENITDRVKGILLLLNSELDTFLSYSIPDICSALKKDCIPLKAILSALSNLKYKISLTHTNFNAVKTNAPLNVVYNIILNYFYIFNNKEYKNANKSGFSQNVIEDIFKLTKEVEEILNKNYYRKLALSKQGPLSKK